MTTQDKNKTMEALNERSRKLVEDIRPLLEQDEYCCIMTKDFNLTVMVPDEVRRRNDAGDIQPVDSLMGLILQWKFMGILLEIHGGAITKNAPNMVQTPKLVIVGPDGKPVDNRS